MSNSPSAATTLSVELDVNDECMTEAARLFRPDLVIAPFLRRAIPEAVWRTVRCLIVHPGPVGDRGPAALDWAILDGQTAWGTTLIEANATFDAGDIWATRNFDLRPAAKSSLYRDEVTEAAVACVIEAIGKIESGVTSWSALSRKRHRTAALGDPPSRSKSVPSTGRRDDTETVLRKLYAASGEPGIPDTSSRPLRTAARSLAGGRLARGAGSDHRPARRRDLPRDRRWRGVDHCHHAGACAGHPPLQDSRDAGAWPAGSTASRNGRRPAAETA